MKYIKTFENHLSTNEEFFYKKECDHCDCICDECDCQDCSCVECCGTNEKKKMPEFLKKIIDKKKEKDSDKKKEKEKPSEAGLTPKQKRMPDFIKKAILAKKAKSKK